MLLKELTHWLPEGLFEMIQESKTEYLLFIEEDSKEGTTYFLS